MPPTRPRSTICAPVVWNLRKALGDTEHRVIASEGEDIVLDVAAFEVDVLAFRRLAAQSGRTELEAAAKLYSGEFLDGLGIESEEFESWRRAEATRCRDQAVDVLTRLMTQLAECGETERAIETGERILRLEPLHEAAVRRLMRLYGESGRRGPRSSSIGRLPMRCAKNSMPSPRPRPALFSRRSLAAARSGQQARHRRCQIAAASRRLWRTRHGTGNATIARRTCVLR